MESQPHGRALAKHVGGPRLNPKHHKPSKSTTEAPDMDEAWEGRPLSRPPFALRVFDNLEGITPALKLICFCSLARIRQRKPKPGPGRGRDLRDVRRLVLRVRK